MCIAFSKIALHRIGKTKTKRMGRYDDFTLKKKIRMHTLSAIHPFNCTPIRLHTRSAVHALPRSYTALVRTSPD
jgi:hypothetical protein